MRAAAATLLGVMLLATLTACGDGQSASPQVVVSLSPTSTPAPTATPTPEPTATPEPTPTPSPTGTPVPTPTFAPPTVILPSGEVSYDFLLTPGPFDLDRKIDAIGFRASLARDLSARGPVDRRIVSTDELRSMLEKDFEEDAEDVEIADRLYTRLGIIEPSVDLGGTLIDAFADIVLGMFRTDDDMLYVVGDEDDFTLQNELTVAHEFVHGLQHLHFDIEGMRDAIEGNSDRSRALRALIEGDASLAELIYRLEYFNEAQQQAFQDETADVDISSFLAAPVFIQRTMVFPYVEGTQFAIDLYLQTQSFDPVNAAYGSPPSSTEQIIHPDKYLVDEPVEVSLPDLAAALAEGWSEADRDVMGELFIRSLLEGEVSREQAGEAAGGWGGDSYVLLRSADGGEALFSVIVWDTKEDATEFAAAASAYLGALTGGAWRNIENGDGMTTRLSWYGTAAQISVDGATVHLVIADSVDELEAVIEAVEPSEISVVFPPTVEATPTAQQGN